jgi:signal peptidase II
MNHRQRSLLIILAVVALDWSSKIYIRAHVSPWDVFPVIPRFFNIVHAENPGAAFSILAEAPERVRAFLLIGVSTVVMLIVGVMLWRFPSPSPVENPVLRIGLSLVFGGALGNLWDRAFRGTVTDFLQFFFGSYEFPSFNVADSAITIGAVLLVLELWRSRKSTA